MEVNKLGIALIATACVAAGAGGAYIATRASAPSPAAQTAPPSVDASPDASLEPPAATVASAGISAGTSAGTGLGTRNAQAAPVAPAPVGTRPVRPAEPRPALEPNLRASAAAPPPDSPAPPTPAGPSASPAPADSRPAPGPPAQEPVGQAEAAEARAAPPEAPQFEELIISANSVIGLQVETSLSSEQARVEDPVVARVTRDVRVGDRVAIPAGARAQGEVTLVERGGKVRGRARLGVRFTSVVLADGTHVPLETDTIYREGDGPSAGSTAKIGGGAIGGAILGGILGGAKGAILGGSVGGGAGAAAVMAGGRSPATLPAGKDDRRCTHDRMSVGVCSVVSYTSSLPSYYQYFPDPRKVSERVPLSSSCVCA